MTSPGGNTVTIVVQSKDQSAAGVNSSTANFKKLAQAVDGGPQSVGGSLEQAGKKARGLGSVLGNVGTIAGGILTADIIREGAQRVTALVQQTVHAASSLGESLNAVDKTFGESAHTIHSWAESNAASFGLSQRAFNEAATPLGAMLKNQGLTMDQVGAQTIKLTERAADMASVFNVNVSDALTAIQAGLRGESDPLERFGVSLQAVAVEARALADSGKTSAAQLTAQEKAVARLNLIYDQTASTAGDFADTSTGLANAQRIASAEIENAQAKIGTTFIPVMAAAANASGHFADTLGAVPTPIAAAVAAVAVAGAAMLVFAPRVIASKEALDKMSESSSMVTRGAGRLALGVGKVAATLAAFQIGGALVGQMIDSELHPQITQLTLDMEKWTRSSEIAGEAARLFGDDAEGLGDALEVTAGHGFFGAVNATDDFAAGLLGMNSLVDESAEKVAAFDSALAALVADGKQDQAFALVAIAADKAGLSIDEVKTLLPHYGEALAGAKKETKDLAEATETTAQMVDRLTKSTHEAIDAAFGYESAVDAVANDVADLTEKIKAQKEAGDAGAGSLTGNTQAARDNREAVRGLVADYEKLTDEAYKSGRSTDGLAQQLQDQLVAMGFSREEAARYTAQIGELGAKLQSIPPVTTADVIVRVQTQETDRETKRLYRASGGIQGAASGGPRSNQVWTGEHGPELLDLPPGTMVHSNPDSMRMAAQGGGGTAQVNISFAATGDAFLDALIRELRKYIRIESGGDVQVALGH